MKRSLLVFFTCISLSSWAQSDSVAINKPMEAPYKRHTTTATLAVGVADNYRRDYTLPTGFQKNNTSGFAPFFVKVEYGLTNHLSLAAAFGYDAFVYNFKQEYTGNNGPFTRYRTNKTRIWSGGITAFYHFGKLIHSKRVDPFVGLGISLNNIRYSNFPQGDSTLIKIDHTVTPYFKVGARYYISDKFSLFGDAGYDKQSVISLGFSCRFFPRDKQVSIGK